MNSQVLYNGNNEETLEVQVNIFVQEEFPNTEYRIVFVHETFPNTEYRIVFVHKKISNTEYQIVFGHEILRIWNTE